MSCQRTKNQSWASPRHNSDGAGLGMVCGTNRTAVTNEDEVGSVVPAFAKLAKVGQPMSCQRLENQSWASPRQWLLAQEKPLEKHEAIHLTPGLFMEGL